MRVTSTHADKHTHPVPAVGAIILRDDEVLLVRRRNEPGRGKWSIPGGSIELGETLVEAVKREVMEETGLEADVGELAGVTDLIIRSEGELIFHYVLIDYFAKPVAGEPVAATDVSECCWVELSDLGNYDLTESLLERLHAFLAKRNKARWSE